MWIIAANLDFIETILSLALSQVVTYFPTFIVMIVTKPEYKSGKNSVQAHTFHC